MTHQAVLIKSRVKITASVAQGRQSEPRDVQVVDIFKTCLGKSVFSTTAFLGVICQVNQNMSNRKRSPQNILNI